MSLEHALVEIDRRLPDGSVSTDPERLETYAHDESDAPPRTPGAIVTAHTTDDVAAVLELASAHDVPVTPRAAGTGRVGGAVPVEGGLVLVLTGMDSILDVDATDGVAVCEPGVVTGDLQAAVHGAGLLYAPDPSSAASCTIGGNVATNAGGPRAFKYGSTGRYVLGLTVVTGDGRVLELGRRTRKGVTGYDLTSLVVGSEGTLAVVTRAVIGLMPRPEAVVTLLALLPDDDTVARAVAAAAAKGLSPRCIELLDHHTLSIVRDESPVPIPDQARAALLVELDGTAQELDRELELAGNALVEAGAFEVLVARHGGDRDRLWAARRSLSRTIRTLARTKLSEDVVVPPSRLAELLSSCRRISEEIDIRMPAYGHAGDGNLHVNYLWDDDGEAPRVQQGVRRLFERVIELGGTLSGEHGLGLTKAEFLPLEQSDDVIAMQRRIKALFDPKNVLNPDKVFPTGRPHGPC